MPEPPASWEQPFAMIAAETVNLPTTDLREGYALAAQFWDPFLTNRATSRIWLANQACWSQTHDLPPEA